MSDCPHGYTTRKACRQCVSDDDDAEIAALRTENERLRERIQIEGDSWEEGALRDAKVITTLRERVGELEGALKPFAHDDLCETFTGNSNGDASVIFQRNHAVLTLGDCRLARRYLLPTSEGPCPECGGSGFVKNEPTWPLLGPLSKPCHCKEKSDE